MVKLVVKLLMKLMVKSAVRFWASADVGIHDVVTTSNMIVMTVMTMAVG